MRLNRPSPEARRTSWSERRSTCRAPSGTHARWREPGAWRMRPKIRAAQEKQCARGMVVPGRVSEDVTLKGWAGASRAAPPAKHLVDRKRRHHSDRALARERVGVCPGAGVDGKRP